MSLAAAPFSFLASAPSFHLTRRHGDEDHSTTSNQSSQEDIICKLKPTSGSFLSCKAVEDPVNNCTANLGDALKDIINDPSAGLTDAQEKSCIDLCESIHNGEFMKSYLGCIEDQCDDYKEHAHHNEEYLESHMISYLSTLCEDLGANKTTTDAAEDEADEDAATKGANSTDAAAKDGDKDSGAVGSWKSATFVFAVVFSSVFSSLLL